MPRRRKQSKRGGEIEGSGNRLGVRGICRGHKCTGLFTIALLVSACADKRASDPSTWEGQPAPTVRASDLQAWEGQPVAELDKHPVFLTMPVVRTMASDGTQIRNYVNGRNIASCTGGGAVFAGTVDFATYSRFAACMHSFAACNNIFYIKNARVVRYTPVGTGGARCFTDERARPGFKGPTNI